MDSPAESLSVGTGRFDFDKRPLVVVWEMTQACDLACLHCRAEAQPKRHPDELTDREARDLLDQVADLDPGVLVLSGGDPMKREDVCDLVRHGCERGIRMAMTPSVTSLLTDAAIRRLAAAGLTRIAFSLDGSCPPVHDSFRGVPGSFARTVEVIDVARRAGLTVQINTTVSRHNLDDLRPIADLLRNRAISLWSVFFLVPVGRGQADQRISPEEYEQVFELLWSLRRQVRFEIKTTEAPHYRRFVLQKLKAERRADVSGGVLDKPFPNRARQEADCGEQPPGHERPAPSRSRFGLAFPDSRGTDGCFRYASMNVNDGRGFVFISHTGEVFPSGFLPLSVGNVRKARLADLYREAPLLRDLRNADNMGGKCGECEYRRVCGGSRARSWALSGDPFAPEPDCVYQPARSVPLPVRN
ncbi:MAG: TIGR04053 family radical SAM/SPASM domain-containing protein [Planctomycetes bacterium]|nr:TIGR04053 family radical SAM/SPASM domain-containing protein [Planctomycetota bacterium]